jgi:hypothetical protein
MAAISEPQASCCVVPYFAYACCGAEVPPDSKYTKVQAYRLNEAGERYKTEDGLDKVYTYQLEVDTGNLYGDGHHCDTRGDVAKKCAGIAFGVFPYCAALMMYNLGNMPVKVVEVASNAIKLYQEEIKSKPCCEAFGNLMRGLFWDTTKEIGLAIYRVARAVFFALAIFFVAVFVTPVDPYLARLWIGRIEKVWHDDVPHTRDPRHVYRDKLKNNETNCIELLSSEVFYLAFCFQPSAHRDNKNIELVEDLFPATTTLKPVNRLRGG